MEKASRADKRLRAFDLFSGGGGSSVGACSAGIQVVGAAEIDAYPVKAYRENFPAVTVYEGDLRTLSPQTVKRDLGRLDVLLASPECTNHTCAKGSAPRSEESKDTALQVVRFAHELRPNWIVLENVVHMRPWKRYPQLKEELVDVGYSVQETVLDSSQFGVPQKRRRLFMVAALNADVKLQPLTPKPGGNARSILDKKGMWSTSMLYRPNRAEGTLIRAERAIKSLGRSEAFLLVYYGTDGSGGWQALDQPLRTVTTVDRFALVEPSPAGHTMRMLQPEELRRAMGFPETYHLPQGTRRSKVKLLGNAVCPPVMEALLRSLTQ